jgi:predicted Zn-dependent peptidase
MTSVYQYHTLKNGIRIVFRQNNSIVTHSGVYINIGSRDEHLASQEGTAHFIEHSIFKGTEHRHAYHILNRIDGVGGELNAFTTKEETCVYASSLSEHLERCLELFADIIFHSTFPQKEIDREKDVVIEEIDSYKDYPSEQIADDYEELAFKGHPLSHNILGNKKNVKRFTTQQLKNFLASNYTTDRMVISVVGSASFARVVHLCEKYFGEYPLTTSAADRSVKPVYQKFNVIANHHSHQLHVMAGCPAYDTYDDRRIPFSLLNNIIGGPAMNSRLNMAIRERSGFCYTVESQYSIFSDAGLFNVYAGIDADAKDRYTELLLKELRRFCTEPLTSQQLRAAQQQLIGQMAISNDLALNEMQSIGKSYMVYDKVDTLEEMKQDIMSVTTTQIQDIANELFAGDVFSFLYYC